MAMNLRQSLGTRQEMSLGQFLTPQMRMNLELIQAPILEALESMEQLVTENPWLERDEEATDPRFLREADRPAASVATPRDQADFEESEAWLDPVAATPWTHEDFPADETQGLTAMNVPTPCEQLEHQIREMDITRRVQDFALALLANLDEHGFLPVKEDEEVSQFFEIQSEEDRAAFEKALHLLRYQLEPVGVGARDQSHCFLIQLELQGKGDSLAARLVREDVLSDIKPRNLAMVARKLGVKETELRDALEDLRRLYSHPLALLDQTTEPTRYPDLIAEKVDGDWQVNLSHPLNGRYRFRDTPVPRKNAMMREVRSDGEDPAEVLKRLKRMRQDARMLINATEYRDRTLYEIGRHLVEEQRDFLEKGEEALKPLLQKEMAERLGMNEATISRILKEKFMLTPRGLLPLNRFFSRSITNEDGEKVSNKAVMDALSKLIAEEEDPTRPWSDQEISLLLKQRSFPISRRTVTKYRQIMGIGAAGDRKATRKIQESR